MQSTPPVLPRCPVPAIGMELAKEFAGSKGKLEIIMQSRVEARILSWSSWVNEAVDDVGEGAPFPQTPPLPTASTPSHSCLAM
jgi:hypothetical protein